MTKTTTIEQGTMTRTGYALKITQRGAKFDVVYCTGFCWKYIAKAVSEQAARNTFFLETL